MTRLRARWTFPLLVLIMASLACQALLGPGPGPAPTVIATARPKPTLPVQPTITPQATRSLEASAAPPSSLNPQPTLPASFEDVDQFTAAMRPEFATDVAQFPNLTRYVIDVAVAFNDDGSATLTGRERIRYTNQQTFALNALYLMLWPADIFSGEYLSDMTLNWVFIDGQEITPELEHSGLAARIALPTPLEPGAVIEVSTEFTVEAFPGVDEIGGVRFGLTNGVLLAPTFYPLVPRILENGEWQTDPAAPGGDTTNSDSAFYVWRVTAPADLAIVATGAVVNNERTGELQTQTLVTGPMRDLALVVGPLEWTQRMVDGITLNAYLLSEHADLADEMLDYTEAQMKNLQEKVGPYPFTELDIVDAPGAFGGIEYPGVIFVGVVDQSGFFVRATVHEVGHQWFYSLIGDDQQLEPWLDEAAASYTEVLYAEAVNGASGARQALEEFETYLFLTNNPELPIGLPVEEYSSADYGVIVYGKGALFFDALRRELGDDTFFDFLHNYYEQYRYGFATSADFQATAEQTCACDLDALFDLWVYKGGPVPER